MFRSAYLKEWWEQVNGDDADDDDDDDDNDHDDFAFHANAASDFGFSSKRRGTYLNEIVGDGNRRIKYPHVIIWWVFGLTLNLLLELILN